MTTECTLCPDRVCTVQGDGRLINDNNGKRPIDTSKIRPDPVPIDKCILKESMEIDDSVSTILLGS